jgi:hypothetical protein
MWFIILTDPLHHRTLCRAADAVPVVCRRQRSSGHPPSRPSVLRPLCHFSCAIGARTPLPSRERTTPNRPGIHSFSIRTISAFHAVDRSPSRFGASSRSKRLNALLQSIAKTPPFDNPRRGHSFQPTLTTSGPRIARQWRFGCFCYS